MIIEFIRWIAWSVMSPAKRAEWVIEQCKTRKGTSILTLDRETINELLRRSDRDVARYSQSMTLIYGGTKTPDGCYEWSIWARQGK